SPDRTPERRPCRHRPNRQCAPTALTWFPRWPCVARVRTSRRRPRSRRRRLPEWSIRRTRGTDTSCANIRRSRHTYTYRLSLSSRYSVQSVQIAHDDRESVTVFEGKLRQEVGVGDRGRGDALIEMGIAEHYRGIADALMDRGGKLLHGD